MKQTRTSDRRFLFNEIPASKKARFPLKIRRFTLQKAIQGKAAKKWDLCGKNIVLLHKDCKSHNKSEKNKERRPPSDPNLHYFSIRFPATPHCKEKAVRDCAEQTPLMPPLRGGMEEVPDGPQPPDGPPLPGNSGKEEEGKIEKENNFEQKRTEPGPLAAARDEAARAGTLPCSSPPHSATALPLPAPGAYPFPAGRCTLPPAAPQKRFGKRPTAKREPFAESVRPGGRAPERAWSTPRLRGRSVQPAGRVSAG